MYKWVVMMIEFCPQLETLLPEVLELSFSFFGPLFKVCKLGAKMARLAGLFAFRARNLRKTRVYCRVHCEALGAKRHFWCHWKMTG